MRLVKHLMNLVCLRIGLGLMWSDSFFLDMMAGLGYALIGFYYL